MEQQRNLDNLVSLVFNNKINIRNAFEVNTQHINDFTDVFLKQSKRSSLREQATREPSQFENGWLKASAGIDAHSKIYGYRVDSIHQMTYRVLSTLNRGNQDKKMSAKDDVSEISNLQEGRQSVRRKKP